MSYRVLQALLCYILFMGYYLKYLILTSSLIGMKETTEKLSICDFKVSLPNLGKDKLGELSSSNNKLAYNVERLKNKEMDSSINRS